MNPSRSTTCFTPLAYLNWIQRGGTDDWKRLYALCKDPGVARAVAAVLPLRDPDLLPSARLWKFLLEGPGNSVVHPRGERRIFLKHENFRRNSHKRIDTTAGLGVTRRLTKAC